MKHRRLTVSAVVMCLLAYAYQPSNARQRPMDVDPYAGIVLNQTVTVVGHDFYRHFAAAWHDREMTERYAISIHERPNARLGSQVWIEYAQRKVFQATLPPSRSQIRALSEQAVDTAYDAIVNADVQRLLLRDEDMAPDEI